VGEHTQYQLIMSGGILEKFNFRKLPITAHFAKKKKFPVSTFRN